MKTTASLYIIDITNINYVYPELQRFVPFSSIDLEGDHNREGSRSALTTEISTASLTQTAGLSSQPGVNY